MKKAKPRLKIDSSSRPTTESTQAHNFHKYATLGKSNDIWPLRTIH